MKQSLWQRFKNIPLYDQIVIALAFIIGIHAAGFLFIILCWFAQTAFHLSTEFWVFFYNFIANGFSFPEVKQ